MVLINLINIYSLLYRVNRLGIRSRRNIILLKIEVVLIKVREGFWARGLSMLISLNFLLSAKIKMMRKKIKLRRRNKMKGIKVFLV